MFAGVAAVLELQAFSDFLPLPELPGRVALRAGTLALSYGELHERTAAAAHALQRALDSRQNIVFVASEDRAALVVALLALNHLAQIAVPLFPGYAPAELAALYETYRPALVIADKRLQGPFLAYGARVADLPDLRGACSGAALPACTHGADDLCFILLTSGSRGPAKGVVLSNRNVLADLEGIQAYMQAGAADTCLITRNLTHASALVAELLLTLLTGGCCSLRGTPAAIRQVFDWCEDDGATWISMPPVMLKAVVEYARSHRRKLRARTAVSAGAMLPPALCLMFLETFPEVRLINAYGLTEASPRVAWLPPELAAVKPGAAGYPISGCLLRIARPDDSECAAGEAGEIQVAGTNVMRGYFPEGMSAAPSHTEAWLRTGDIGVRDADGVLFILGRSDSMCIHNGVNVYPEYVAGLLERSPHVCKAAVACMGAGTARTRMVAFVEPAPGAAGDAVLREIRAYLKETLDIRKHPDEIVLVPELPLTRSGKTDFAKLFSGFHRMT